MAEREIPATLTDIICPTISGVDSDTRLLKVTVDSKKSRKNAVDKLGKYFSLEVLHESHESGEVYEDYDYSDRTDFLWLHPEATISPEFSIPCIGACCFIHDGGNPKTFSLHWVWIHPYWRRQRLLENALPEFHKQFGDFDIISPLSPEMQQFVKKHNLENNVV